VWPAETKGGHFEQSAVKKRVVRPPAFLTRDCPVLLVWRISAVPYGGDLSRALLNLPKSPTHFFRCSVLETCLGLYVTDENWLSADSAVSFPVSFLGLTSESIHELLSPQCVAEFRPARRRVDGFVLENEVGLFEDNS
jgi:hypothetical protein